MRDDYLLVLSGHNTLREIELSSDSTLVRAGTTQRCDVRFRKEAFFSPFELEFVREDDGQWAVSCSEEVYLSVDGVQKIAFKKLKHGDEAAVKYAVSNTTLFTLRFSIDFERDRGAYDRSVSLEHRDVVTIGGMPNCNICLNGSYTDGDLLVLERMGEGFRLTEQSSRYGALFNGRRIENPVIVEDCSFISVANFHFYYKDSHLFCSKAADISFNDIEYKNDHVQCRSSEYPRFNRNTRIKSAMDEEKIPLLMPPAQQDQPRTNIVVQLLPAIGMLAVTVLLRGSLMNSAGSQGFIIISACSIGVGILASVLGIVSEKRRFKKESQEREEKYTAYIEQKRAEVASLREEELESLRTTYSSVREDIDKVRDFSGDLFDRREIDADYLHLYLGVGARLSVKQVDYRPKEELEIDNLAELPRATYEEFREIQDAPIVVDLHESNAVGIVGPASKCNEVMKRTVIDLCTRHYQNDVRLFFVVEPENESLIHWARMLPHVQNDELNCRNIVCDEESKNVLYEYLYKELTEREASKGARISPSFVVFVIDECGMKNHPLSRFVDKAASLGTTFLFFEQMKEFLPLGCDRVITLSPEENNGVVIDAQNEKNANHFAYEPVLDEDASLVAKTLAPVYCEEVSLEGTLTKSISLFEMLGIISADDLDLGARWASSAVHASLAAPLGVSKSKTVYLDLHDKAHGPHGLVAGTTGSGKSEILQTYVLSMATLFHPYEISFVIIDFKGGGMVNQFRDLPHLVGAITNIDGREIDRSLKSIKAELQKRQRLFAETDVNHINAYIKKFKSGQASEPLPHLIIIVDEFAELRAEQPEFMKELISASRIGRSLGVHLILATQKPAGQVNEQIWSNSRFKLCLKVQSQEDSNEVIKSPLAAEIKEPGRAYLQVGNNEIFDLFQSAYSGAPEHEDDDNVKEFTVYQVENSGKRVPVFERRRTKSDNLSVTQLDSVVSHVARHCERSGIAKLPSICLPPLPDVVPFPSQPLVEKGALSLGVYDDPDSQYQGAACFDIDNTNTFIVGSAQSGKTNLLQTIIRAIAQTKTPEQASLYILDFSSMILKNFEALNHVGGVVVPSEDEKLKNLFKLLNEEVAQRKKRLLEVGVSSFSSYEEAGYTDLPHVYVIIDNFAVFKELYAERFEDELLAICRDGLAYGISVVISNNASSGFGFKYMSNFSTYIALPCNDSAEYSVVFDRCRMEPKNVPGRALCSFDKTVYEFQSYLSFEGEREVDRVKAMRAFVEARNACSQGRHARRIPSVPDDLTLEYIQENYDILPQEMAFALDYGTVEPVRLPLNSQFSLSIVGKDSKAKLALVRTLLSEVRENIFERPVEVHIVDGITRDLVGYRDLPFVSGYHSDASGIDTVLEIAEETLSRRYRRAEAEGLEALENEPYLVVIVNSADATAHVSDSKEQMEAYGRMAKQYSGMKVLFVFSDVPDIPVSYSAPALLKALKEERRAFVLADLADHRFFDVNASTARAFKGALEDGQAFYINESDVSKVKIAGMAPEVRKER